jgi:IPT/TIG domain/PASTA domain
MRLLARIALPAAVALAVLGLCGPAEAANVTLGPSLSGAWEAAPCAKPWCTFVNTEASGTGKPLVAPVDGAVVGFSVVGGSTAGSYRIRTASELGDGLEFEFNRLGTPVAAVPNAGIQSYSTLMPVTAGQSIGLGVSKGASMAFSPGGHYVEWVRELPESGPSLVQADWPESVGYDVEIQPAPTITGLSATFGPMAGGTAVTLTGADLEGATSVTFGGIPATRFNAVSASRITAVPPPSPKAATVPITVTTAAGKGTGPGFTYLAPGEAPPKGSPSTARCVVPNLKGKKLAAAKKVLVKARCELGKVTKLGGATTRTGKVAKQSPKPGAKLAAGAKVNTTLKP